LAASWTVNNDAPPWTNPLSPIRLSPDPSPVGLGSWLDTAWRIKSPPTTSPATTPAVPFFPWPGGGETFPEGPPCKDKRSHSPLIRAQHARSATPGRVGPFLAEHSKTPIVQKLSLTRPPFPMVELRKTTTAPPLNLLGIGRKSWPGSHRSPRPYSDAEDGPRNVTVAKPISFGLISERTRENAWK